MKIRKTLAVCLSLLFFITAGCQLSDGKVANSGVSSATVSSSFSTVFSKQESSASVTANSRQMQSDSDNEPKIINQVSAALKAKYSDIVIANEWVSPKYNLKGTDERYTVLFGALKKDPLQGVAKVIHTDADGTAVKQETQYLSPKRKGPVRVYKLGAKEDDMEIIYPDGETHYFIIYGGFQTP